MKLLIIKKCIKPYLTAEVEVQKYPVKGEPITREFIAYINNAMLADSDVQSQYVAGDNSLSFWTQYDTSSLSQTW